MVHQNCNHYVRGIAVSPEGGTEYTRVPIKGDVNGQGKIVTSNDRNQSVTISNQGSGYTYVHRLRRGSSALELQDLFLTSLLLHRRHGADIYENWVLTTF